MDAGKTATLKEFLDCTDSKKAKAILEKLEDWMLAGLVVWKEVNATQEKWITKKLPLEPKEVFLKYWVDKSIPKKNILIKTGHFEDFSSPTIQETQRPTGCRGRHSWPNKQMKRGDVRLSIRLPNPNNPYYIGKDWDPYTGRPTSGDYMKENLVTYYFCAKCSIEYIDYKARYKPIKAWWNKSLKSEKEVIKAQIIDQKKKEDEKAKKIAAKKAEKTKLAVSGPIVVLADKIVKSNWGGAAGDKPAMKKMATSMKKSNISSEILEEVLWAYMFHEDNSTRTVAKKAFIELAPEDSIDVVKKNWKSSFRKGGKLTDNLAKLGKGLINTNLNFTNLLIKALEDCEDPSHYLHSKSGYYTKEDRYPTIDALGIIGDAHAIEPLGQFLVTALSGDYSDWKSEAIPTITSSLVKFGEPATVHLVEALKRASDCRKGVYESQHYYLRGKSVVPKNRFTTAAEIIAKDLTKLRWKPETDELLALQLIAMGKWSDCVKLGASAVEPLISNFRHRGEAKYDIVKTLGEIGDARAVKVTEDDTFHNSNSRHAEWWQYQEGYEILEMLGKINDLCVIPAILDALEEASNHKRPPKYECRCWPEPKKQPCPCFSERCPIEKLGTMKDIAIAEKALDRFERPMIPILEYYENGLLKMPKSNDMKLEHLDGVGPAAAKKLHKHGFDFDTITDSTPAELSEATGISIGSCKTIVESAKKESKIYLYGLHAPRVGVGALKILSKFEKRIMKNYTNDDIDYGPLLSGKPIERRWLAIILQKIANKKLKGEEKEKILKFLESKKPEMIQMGASLLKASIK